MKFVEMEKDKTAEDAFGRVQTARDAERPYTSDLIQAMFEGFVEIHGDRRYADDSAMIGGFAVIGGIEAAVVGQQKGRDLNQRRFRNFGMPKPEGYRKALRIMKLAEKFGRPVITFVDTPGAYPGIDAEERGQAEAIAFNLREMANLRVPIIVVILGEGGSGGALAIGVGDRVLMLENAVYSVITPEGCAAILWKDAGEAAQAAQNLRLTANDLLGFGLVDETVAEPSEGWRVGGDSFKTITGELKKSILKNLSELDGTTVAERRRRRYEKFRKMGRWV